MRKNDTKGFIENLKNSIEDEMLKNLVIDAFEQILKEIYRDNGAVENYFDDDGTVKHEAVLSKLNSLLTSPEETCASCQIV